MKKTVRKIIAITLVVMLLCAIAPIQNIADFFSLRVSAEGETLAPSGQCGDDAYWTFDETTGTLTISGTGCAGCLVVNPGWGVTMFRGQDSIRTLIVQPGITALSGLAFFECTNLESVTLPNTLTVIGGYAFQGCTSLTEIVVPESVTRFDGYNVFRDCTSLESITLSSNITNISERTFYNCASLKEIIIPTGVTEIGTEAFMGCTSLESLTLYSGNLVTIEKRAFKNCSALERIDIPDSVTKLGEEAFWNCTSALSITIGDSLTVIPDNAFYKCSSVTSLTLGDSVTTIGFNTFAGCESVEYLYIGSSFEDTFRKLINNLIGLKTIEVSPDNQYYCSDSNGVLFNKDKTEIVCYPRANTRTSYTIPDSVTSVGFRGLYDCDNLSYLTIGSGLQSKDGVLFETMGSMVEYSVSPQNNYFSSDSSGVLYNKDKTALIAFPQNKSVNGYVIPNSVTCIDEYAFCCNDSLTSFTVPDGITSIGRAAFWNCTSLTSVELPESADAIVSLTFKDCTSLTNVNLPDNMETIPAAMFMGCTALAEITLPNNLKSIGNNAFRDCISLTSISIPSGVTLIDEYAFTGCTSLEIIYIPDSVLQIDNTAFGTDDKIDVTIACFKDSAAQTFANNYGFNFEQLVKVDLDNLKISNATATSDGATVTLTANQGATQVNLYPTLKDGTQITFSDLTGGVKTSKNGTLYAKSYGTATATYGDETISLIFDFPEDNFDIENQARFANAEVEVESKTITLYPVQGATQVSFYPTLKDGTAVTFSNLSGSASISKSGTLYSKGNGSATATIGGKEYTIVFAFRQESKPINELIRTANANISVSGTTITLTAINTSSQISIYPTTTDGDTVAFSNLSAAKISKSGTCYAKANASCEITIDAEAYSVYFEF